MVLKIEIQMSISKVKIVKTANIPDHVMDDIYMHKLRGGDFGMTIGMRDSTGIDKSLIG